VQRERRRLAPSIPQLDPRTKRTGVKGARARVGAREWIGKEIAEAAGCSPGTVSELVRDGVLTAIDRGARGRPSRWSPAQARAAIGVLALRSLAGKSGIDHKRAVFDLLVKADDSVFAPGRFLIAGDKPVIASEAGLARLIYEAGVAVAVLNLGTLADVKRAA
jgi:hypothetical protein